MTHELHPICNIHQVSCSRILALKLFLSSQPGTDTQNFRPGRISSSLQTSSFFLLHSYTIVWPIAHVNPRHSSISHFECFLFCASAPLVPIYYQIGRASETAAGHREQVQAKCQGQEAPRRSQRSVSLRWCTAGPVDATVATPSPLFRALPAGFVSLTASTTACTSHSLCT